MAALVASALPPGAIAASCGAFELSVFAYPSNSDRFCQISGMAREVLGSSEPSGKRAGICFDVSTSFWASGPIVCACPALALSWIDFMAAPYSFISFWRAAMASLEDILGVVAHAVTTAMPTTRTVVFTMIRFIGLPLRCGRATRGGRPGEPRSLHDPVAHSRDRLQILCDRPPLVRRQVLVAGHRSLDDFGHEPVGHIAIRLVSGPEIVGNLLFAPLQARLRIRRDVRDDGFLRPVGGAGQEPRDIGRHRHGAWRVALAAVTDGARQVLAPRRAGRRRRRRRRLVSRERRQPRRQE